MNYGVAILPEIKKTCFELAEIPSKNHLVAAVEKKKNCPVMNKEEIPEPQQQLKE